MATNRSLDIENSEQGLPDEVVRGEIERALGALPVEERYELRQRGGKIVLEQNVAQESESGYFYSEETTDPTVYNPDRVEIYEYREPSTNGVGAVEKLTVKETGGRTEGGRRKVVERLTPGHSYKNRSTVTIELGAEPDVEPVDWTVTRDHSWKLIEPLKLRIGKSTIDLVALSTLLSNITPFLIANVTSPNASIREMKMLEANKANVLRVVSPARFRGKRLSDL